MVASIVFKFSIVFALIAFVYAKAESESELEQPTKLLGGILNSIQENILSLTAWNSIGILRKPEQCRQTVINNSNIKLHYRARVWGSEEFYENTYTGEPQEFKLGKWREFYILSSIK